METGSSAQKSSKNIPWWRIDFGEDARSHVMRAIDAHSYSMGSATKEMEGVLAEFLNVKHCVAVTNGTSALLLALIALGIKSRDEVVIQDRTWIAAANAVQILGATIKLADVEYPPLFSPNSTRPALASVECIEELITSKTKAIIVSHMNGRVFAEPELDKLRSFGIPIIEDSAQALGSQEPRGKYLGTIFDIGCFSLAMTKLVSAGQGGFVVTNDDYLAKNMRLARIQGVEQVFDATWSVRGLNFRMTDLHASIALSQINKRADIFKRQREVLATYTQHFRSNSEVSLVGRGSGLVEIGPYVECIVKNRKLFLDWLIKNGVEARPFYPNLASAPHINLFGLSTPNSKKWGQHGVYLPSGPGISEGEILTVCRLINQFSSMRRTESITTL